MKGDEARKKLLQLIDERETSLKEVSLAVGRNHAYLQQFVHRHTPQQLPESVREALGRHFGIDADYFRDGHRDRKPANVVIHDRLDDFVLIPAYDTALSAGHGAINAAQREPIHHLAFRLDWLRSRTSAATDRLAVLTVAGTSMEPELRHGDMVLVDLTVTRFTRDGMYAISRRSEDEVMVKHVERSMRDGTLTVISANPTYGRQEGVRDDDLVFWGRVIWVGRNVG